MVKNKYLKYKEDKTVVSARINVDLYQAFKVMQRELKHFDIELSLSRVLEIAIREAIDESNETYKSL